MGLISVSSWACSREGLASGGIGWFCAVVLTVFPDFI